MTFLAVLAVGSLALMGLGVAMTALGRVLVLKGQAMQRKGR